MGKKRKRTKPAPVPTTPEQRSDQAQVQGWRTDRHANRQVATAQLAALPYAGRHISDATLEIADAPQASLLRLHEARRVDEAGAPELREAFFRHLGCEAIPATRTARLAALDAVLEEMVRTHPNILVLLVEHVEGASIRRIAVSLDRTYYSVQRALAVGKRHMRARFDELYLPRP